MDHKCEEPLGSLSEFSFRRALAPSQWPLLLIRAPKMAVSHTNFKCLQNILPTFANFKKKHQKKAGKAWGRREKGQTAFEKAPYREFFFRSYRSCARSRVASPPSQDFRSAGAAVGSGIGSVSSQGNSATSQTLRAPSHPNSSPIHPSHRPAHRGPQVVSFETRLGQQLPPSRGEEKTNLSWLQLDWIGKTWCFVLSCSYICLLKSFGKCYFHHGQGHH